jgi:hypothetical protein
MKVSKKASLLTTMRNIAFPWVLNKEQIRVRKASFIG